MQSLYNAISNCTNKLKNYLFTIFLLFSFEILADTNIIYIRVALCDNVHQGIVKVSEKLGKGDDLQNNLYWGAAYGIKSFFKKQKEWKLIDSQFNITDKILERVIFENKENNAFIIADAYNGKFIQEAILNYLTESIQIESFSVITNKSKSIRKLNVFVGHNGLMDQQLDSKMNLSNREIAEDGIVLACMSKKYFQSLEESFKLNHILLTNSLMAPEAYIVHNVVNGWLNKEGKEKLIQRASESYAKYQKISVKTAKGIFK
ncbi:MAG: hypothetical protein SFU98_13970 [Leptospiraceae bacterium]|nr:hypothetical protein [Leptospiraceae bacterium]